MVRYVLRCADNTFYTGITTDIVRRMDMHCRGSSYIVGRSYDKLLYAVAADGRSDASQDAVIDAPPDVRQDRFDLVGADTNKDLVCVAEHGLDGCHARRGVMLLDDLALFRVPIKTNQGAVVIRGCEVFKECRADIAEANDISWSWCSACKSP